MIEEVRALFSDLFEAAAVGRRAGTAIAGRVGQTQARWQTLWTIDATPVTVPQIGRRLGVSRQNIQRLVNDLAADGLVVFVDNPDHKTSPLVALTDHGRAVLDEINTAGNAFNAELLESLGPEHVERLRKLLTDFTTAMKAAEPGAA